MIQAKFFAATYIVIALLAGAMANFAHLANTDFRYRVRLNLILRGHPFDHFSPVACGSPFLPHTIVAGEVQANGKPVGCVDMGGQVFYADDHGQEKFDGSTLLIIPALLELLFSAIAVIALLFLLGNLFRRGSDKGRRNRDGDDFEIEKR